MAEVIVGIDLGTSNCVVAHCDDAGRVTTLADEAGYKIHPSVVSFLPSGGVVVGAEAKQRKVIDPQNTVYSAKRLIGRSFRSPEVQMAKARMPYQIREGANQLPLISTRAGEFAIPEVSAVLLDYARNIAAKALATEVTQAVITVPANFNDAQRTATATAGAIAGITVVRVLNEPTAAALAYGHARSLRQTIAVYDFGGGTFDITILKLDDQVYEVLGTAGDSFLGGDDLDERLVDRMVERFLAEQRIDLRTNEVAMMRLRAVAEQTKIELSRRSRAVVRIDEIAYGANGAPLNLQIEITRDEFVAMVSDIIQRTFPVCQDALKLAGLGVDRIDDIVLVGGTTKVPVVRDHVAKFFGRPPRNDINAEEAVAMGAALQADSLQRILARSSSTGARRAAFEGDDEYTSESTTSTDEVTATGHAAARPKRVTADIAGGRPFSERPMTRGLSVDRYESKTTSKPPPPAGVPVGRLDSSPRPPTEVTSSGDQLGTATARAYAADEEESTAARPLIDPSAEDTSSGAPIPVVHESTRSSMNPVATGRRPAPASRQYAAQQPPPSTVPLRPVPPITGAPPRAPTAPPPIPSSQRPSRSRMAAPSRVPVRDSMPAIDLEPEHETFTSERPARPSHPALGDSFSSAASTAAGMSLPHDPAVTARGLVPDVPASLAGQPLPSTTARGVAPAAPTMMGLAGLGSTQQGWPVSEHGSAPPPSAPLPSAVEPLAPLAPVPAGPNARTMMAQPLDGLGDLPPPKLAPGAPTMMAAAEEAPRARRDVYAPLPPASLHTPMPFQPPPARAEQGPAPFFPPSPGAPPSSPAPFFPGAPPPSSPGSGFPGAPAAPFPVPAMPPLSAAPVVLEVTPVGLGIVTVAGFCEELIRRNSRVPTEVRKLFSTSRDAQDVVRIIVHQGEARRIEGNVVIGELVLADLPPKPRGETSIEVAFSIDASGILHVRARDAVSGREQRVSFNVIGSIPEGEVAASRDRMQQLRR
ncbi:MAG: Hsp70 family protein [Kofleriaceae bacterium]